MASVPTCTSTFTFAARAASSTRWVPSTFTRKNSSGAPHVFTVAAAWTTASQPSMPRRSASASSRSPRTGSAPASRTVPAALSERASARTSSPRAFSASMSRRPTKPEPPVTNTRIDSPLTNDLGSED